MAALFFDEIMEEIEIEQYLKPVEEVSLLGRPGYNDVKMLKTVLSFIANRLSESIENIFKAVIR